MNTREYQNYKRMTKMTVRFLEKDGTITKAETATKSTTTTTTAATATAATTASLSTRATTPIASIADSKSTKTATTTTMTAKFPQVEPIETHQPSKKESTPVADMIHHRLNRSSALKESTDDDPTQTTKLQIMTQKSQKSVNGRYINWSSNHATLASLPWCCIGDLMAFCDKHEYRSLSRSDPQLHNRIATEVKALLSGAAPFDIRKRFPSNIHSAENLWVCIGRCASVEYHLNRIISIFRKPLEKLSADKQRMVRHDFHLAIRELRLDISARISEVRLYDQHVFEKEFRLEWQEEPLAE